MGGTVEDTVAGLIVGSFDDLPPRVRQSVERIVSMVSVLPPDKRRRVLLRVYRNILMYREGLVPLGSLIGRFAGYLAYLSREVDRYEEQVAGSGSD